MTAAEVGVFGDSVDDSICQGDITAFGAGHEENVVVALSTACSSDPHTSPHWNCRPSSGYCGITHIIWSVDTTGDGVDEYSVHYSPSPGGPLVASVYDLRDDFERVCDAVPNWDGNRGFSAGFARSCIGSPHAFHLQAYMVWDDSPYADECDCHTDVAPDRFRFSPAISYGSPPPAPAPPPPPPPPPRSGYWMLGAKGSVYAFGDARHLGDAPVGAATAVDIEPTPSFDGYWVVDDAGRVFTFGDAPYAGAVNALPPEERVTAISGTWSGRGYWLFTSRGRAFGFGDAVHRMYGDMSGSVLNGPVLDSTPTWTGNGYYMVASDGGIFAFGDARFRGSMGGHRLNKPVESLVSDGDNDGYWLVASDGGVFAFDAPFRGSMGGARLNRPITGMVRFGDGYLMVAEDGGIFNFSNKPFHGSLGGQPPPVPIVNVAALNG
ncbi:MAG TPA: hypothetical protein VHF47_14150 [Acidimicrobiales bacterium]|nr:hypothetical protein [Acidimicrobiales bacterium]